MPSDGHLALGLQENIVCDVPLLRSSPCLREVLHENESNLQLLSSLVVMSIINGIARGGSPCALVLPSLAPEKRMLWESNT